MLAIEPFDPADLPLLQAMMSDYLLEFDPHSDPAAEWDDEYFSAWLAGVAAGTHAIWLARKDGAPAGFALVRIEQHWYRRSRRMGSVEEFYVVPAYRRGGIGSALARQAIVALRAQGAQSIAVSVVQLNLAALLFWQRLGFRIEAYHLFLTAL